MLSALLVGATLAVSCPETKIVNHTKVWNEQDAKTLKSAKSRCSYYYPNSPCVKVFIKKDATTYNAVCGR